MGEHVKVPQSRVSVHIASEAVALLVAVPLLLATAANPRPTDAQRRGLRALAFGTMLVDGWLLTQWARQREARADG